MRIVILGNPSAIAAAAARIWAEKGAELLLLARNTGELERLAGDLRVRGARVETLPFESEKLAENPRWYEQVLAKMPRFEILLVAFGYLGNNKEALENPEAARRIAHLNFTATVEAVTPFVPRFAEWGGGTIAVISSVAGDRGRGANSVYGAAKAGVTAYVGALRNWLFPRGVRVVTIKPGLIRTPMTAHLPSTPVTSTPQRIAPALVRAVEKGRSVVYLPGYWRWIMLIIRLLPEWLFKRLHT